MNDDRLTDWLAVQVMGWRTAPGRFIKSGRAWIPSWKFAPLRNLDDAFELLTVSACVYTLRTGRSGIFEAEVRVGRRVGKGSGEPKARAITLALVRAMGLEISEEADGPRSRTPYHDKRSSRSTGDGV